MGEIIAKLEKQEKYLLILHEATRYNYFIVKFLLKQKVAREILFTHLIALNLFNII